jgi:hypothetical protein
MEAMRHSDIRLTTKTYTDTGLLPVSDAVVKLLSFTRPQLKDSHTKFAPRESSPVHSRHQNDKWKRTERN